MTEQSCFQLCGTEASWLDLCVPNSSLGWLNLRGKINGESFSYFSSIPLFEAGLHYCQNNHFPVSHCHNPPMGS